MPINKVVVETCECSVVSTFNGICGTRARIPYVTRACTSCEDVDSSGHIG